MEVKNVSVFVDANHPRLRQEQLEENEERRKRSTHPINQPLSRHIQPNRCKAVEPIPTGPNRLGKHLLDTRDELVLLSLRLGDEAELTLRGTEVEGVVGGVLCVSEMGGKSVREKGEGGKGEKDKP
jgi:hypothetical protein